MADFARAEFALDVRQEDGHTLKQHLITAWKQTGKKPAELAVPDKPPSVEYLWEYWRELHRCRNNFGWGHMHLTHLEIDAWKRNTKRKLDPWELEAILQVDNAYIASIPPPKSKGS